MRADLVLLWEDPLRDIRATRSLMRFGVLVWRLSLLHRKSYCICSGLQALISF
jgi:hypothetical protein